MSSKVKCGLFPLVFNGEEAAKTARMHFLTFHAEGKKQVRGLLGLPRLRKRRCQAADAIDAIMVSDDEDDCSDR